MEKPRYADINDAGLREMEAGFGCPLTRQLALWSIRNRTNRQAVERILEDDAILANNRSFGAA